MVDDLKRPIFQKSENFYKNIARKNEVIAQTRRRKSKLYRIRIIRLLSQLLM